MSHFAETTYTEAFKSRVSAGLCGRCGQRPPREGKPTCVECRQDLNLQRKKVHDTRRQNGLCIDCGKDSGGNRCCEGCREKRKQFLVNNRIALKVEVFDAYGGAICSCLACPERENPRIEFLTLNHIGGGGTKHRAALGGVRKPGGGISGDETYRWLKKNGFPPGYNVLCWNCQWGVHVNKGICPHEKGS